MSYIFHEIHNLYSHRYRTSKKRYECSLFVLHIILENEAFRIISLFLIFDLV